MKVSIIGGSGFVGSNITQSFISKFDVQNVDPVSPKISIFKNSLTGNVEDLEVVRQVQLFKPDIILVLAGKQYTTPQQPRRLRKEYFQANVKIAESLSSNFANQDNQPHLFFVSTDMVYGLPGLDLVTEKCIPIPIGEYGRSKLEAEKIFLKNFERCTIIRPRLIVGSGRTGTIQSLAKLINRGLPIPIFGSGNNRYQMIGVTDLWDAIELLLHSNHVGLFNIGSDAPPTLNELFERIRNELKLRNRIIHLNPSVARLLLEIADLLGLSPLVHEQFALASENCLLSTEKLKSLGWTPKHDDISMMKSSLKELLN